MRCLNHLRALLLVLSREQLPHRGLKWREAARRDRQVCCSPAMSRCLGQFEYDQYFVRLVPERY